MQQLRSFVFTWNNYPQGVEEIIQGGMPAYRYLTFGYEVGESGTPHLQGYCQLEKKISFKKLAGMFPWHIESVKGTPVQASAYCKKEGNFKEFGALSDPKGGSKLASEKWEAILGLAQEGQMEAIQREHPGEYIRHLSNLHRVRVEAMTSNSKVKKCYWLFGKPGTGKSRFANDYCKDDVYFKNPNKWWDNFKGERHVIIDDLGKEHSVLGYHIKRWSDRYPVLCESKGSSLYPDYDVMFITSNYRVEEVFADTEMQLAIKRRFKVIEVFDFEESLEGILSIKTSGLYDYKLINKFNLDD